MGHLLGLPPELLGLIAEYLHDDKVTLRSLSQISYALLRPSQAQSFKCVNVWDIHIDDMGSFTNVKEIQKRILLNRGGAQLLSYTRIPSLSFGDPLVCLRRLDDIFDHLIAFKNVRQLKILLFATHYVRDPLTSPARHSGHFQPTLHSLHLRTWSLNPRDLITFLAFFPFLDNITVETVDPYTLHTLPGNELEGLESATLSPFRGSLKLREFYQENAFVLELAKSRVQYHTLSFHNVTVWTGIQELIVTCAPTLRVLRFFSERLPLPLSRSTQ